MVKVKYHGKEIELEDEVSEYDKNVDKLFFPNREVENKFIDDVHVEEKDQSFFVDGVMENE